MPTLLGFVIVSCFFWLQSYPESALSELLTRVDLTLYDYKLRVNLDQNQPQEDRIVIVDIDEKSLAEQGRWPWPRNKLAALTEHLWEMGAIIVVYDIVLAEKENNITTTIKEALQSNGADKRLILQVEALKDKFDHDTRLANAFAEGEVVTGYTFQTEHRMATGVLPPSPIAAPEGAVANSEFVAFPSFTGNIQKLQQHAIGSGYFTVTPDIDGITRRVQLVKRFGNTLYPSLSLEALRVYLAEEKIFANFEDQGIPTIKELYLGKDHVIPVNYIGEFLVPYRGAKGQFQYISATDIINKRIDPSILDQKIVLVGTTAQGLFDLKSTPVARRFPGVEVHANLISAFLDNRHFTKPIVYEKANFVVAFLLAIILAILFPRMTTSRMLALSFVASVSIVGWNYWLWTVKNYDISLGTPLLLILFISVFNFAWGFFTESRGRELLKQRFGEYVPTALVEKMADNPTEYNLDGESRELTVLFADIRSFTTISESLEAAELKKMLNHFFTPMTKVIFEHNGTIDKYVGDMIMAFWGAPIHFDDHREKAIEAALHMLKQVEVLRPEFEERGWPEVNIGIGLNTGMMNVGDMGSQYRRAYTVLGDSVNLASRLEGTTKFYGVSLVVGENTAQDLHDKFLFKKLDLVKVKGKKEAVTVYEPICIMREATEAQLQEVIAFHRCLEHYSQQEWSEAIQILNDLCDQYPTTTIYPMYLKRIEQLKRRPNMEEWDGVYERREK